MITTKNNEINHSRPSFDIEAVVISAPARTAWEKRSMSGSPPTFGDRLRRGGLRANL
jgi:hypothetical protein